MRTHRHHGGMLHTLEGSIFHADVNLVNRFLLHAPLHIVASPATTNGTQQISLKDKNLAAGLYFLRIFNSDYTNDNLQRFILY